MRRSAPLLVLGAALVTPLAAPADDAIKAKLDAAKLAYKVAGVEHRQAVGTWFDARDDAARKAGNKKLVDLIKSERKAFEEKGDLPKGAPKNLLEQISPARTALEAAYREAVKGYTRARMDQEAEAVEKEYLQFLKSRPAGVKGAFPTITPAMLKAKLAGRATYDQKSGVLTLTYLFAAKEELKDFELGDTKPTLAKGGIAIPSGESVRHVVMFDTMTVTTVLGVKQLSGKVLTTTDGTSFHSDNCQFISFYVPGGGGGGTSGSQDPRGGNVRVKLTITDEKVALQYGPDTILRKTPPKPPAGQLQLHGGGSGYTFSSLTIAGRVNPDWAAAFFTE